MKELLISIVILIAGIILAFSGWEINRLLWGFIPMNEMVIGIFAIVVGVIGTIVGIASLKKDKQDK